MLEGQLIMSDNGVKAIAGVQLERNKSPPGKAAWLPAGHQVHAMTLHNHVTFFAVFSPPISSLLGHGALRTKTSVPTPTSEQISFHLQSTVQYMRTHRPSYEHGGQPIWVFPKTKVQVVSRNRRHAK